MNTTSGHIELDGPSRRMKFWLIENGIKTLRHNIEARGEAVGDPGSPDPYGQYCKAPPGEYLVGVPERCAVRPHADQDYCEQTAGNAPYGCWFTPLIDSHGLEAMHGRAGIGIHGGGSALVDPFKLEQGWTPAEGCIRLQNYDNENVFVPFVNYVRSKNSHPDTSIRFTISWENTFELAAA